MAETTAQVHAPPPPPARPARTSLRPALVVTAIAVVLVVVFSIGSVLSSPPARRARVASRPTSVPGSSLLAVPAARALSPIRTPGQPPTNIVTALVVPEGAQRVQVWRNSAATGQYDRRVSLQVPATERAVLRFYQRELGRHGWRLLSTSAASPPGAVRVLAQKGGTDGWYWEAAVTVLPTTFGHGRPRTAGSATQATPFSLELIQQPDNL